jgi:hypothetical protein
MAYGLGTFGNGGLGDMLSSQVGDETDELRKKRLQDMQALMGGMGSTGGDNNSVFGRFDQFAQMFTRMGRGVRQRFGGGGFMQ